VAAEGFQEAALPEDGDVRAILLSDRDRNRGSLLS
jgi:hypothetical protein